MSYLFVFLANLIYLPAIWFGVVNDDSAALKLNPYNVKRAKIFSIILHIVVAEYIYIAFGASQASLVAAILFSVHPGNIQIPCWMSGKSYGINALIFLMILTFAPFATPLYFLSNLSTAAILFTPLIFLFTKYWYIVLLFPLLVLKSFKGITDNINSKVKSNETFFISMPSAFELYKFEPKKLIIAVKTFGYYALACLLPMKNGFYNSFLTTFGSSKKATAYWYSLNRHFWGGVFAIVLMAAIWWVNKFNFIGMGIMLFVLSILPFLNFVTVQQFTASRYVYLPLVGFQIALANLVFLLPLEPRWAIFGALFLFYLDRTLRLMKHYKTNDIDMIILDSQVFPENGRLWYYRTEHMMKKGNPIMAWSEASYGLKYLPEDCQLWFGLACASYELGDFNAASEFNKTAERFMILTERINFKPLIDELKERVKIALVKKYVGKGRF